MDRRQFITRTAGLAAAAPLAGLATPALAVTGSSNIVELAAATPDLSTLVTAVQAAGLVDTLSGRGNFTVFAPTNRAFDHLPAGTLDALLADIPALTNVLTYHVSPDYYPASQFVGQVGAVHQTVQGQPIRVDGRSGTVLLNGNTRVTTADVFASNGVVHIIDAVLLPH
ncbi:fasciclin domain-containing protein [Hasllibacter sp. MH4015]|uniref:fasciclin domain-containing protein n=1 Tax=Hasllibacter sp. MH4015 TaxID=2854029 RepID=UPI001CD2C61F|nr:fasciclin domain-containing protein [Hasllibacter sp. MH4015]